jgi:hypothetical protein
MPRTVTLDTLELGGARLSVNLDTGEIRLEVAYSVGSSTEGVWVDKVRELSYLLLPEERTSILTMTARIKSALEGEELS